MVTYHDLYASRVDQWLLARRLRARYGLRLGETWPGLLAGTTVWFSVLAIPTMELIQLYVVPSAAASGINLGDGC
ncbi:hypothetical protein [Streptomyces virginiae]|uniref:hypothetical protein n=1 Tax=Streptomyces virginiae TaxID=1961 RepID=UPI00343E7FDE